VPYLFFAATKGASPVESVSTFLAELKESPLPGNPDLVPESPGGSWPDAFRILASVIADSPAVVVLDEIPWLAEQDDTFDGSLQTAWDRLLVHKGVLLLMLGSDIHMMERLTAYDRPFFGRADNMVLGPLNPAETGQAVGLDAADAIDAHLISGGLPGIIRSWPHGTPPLAFLEQECADPASTVFSVPESALLAEFPSPDLTRRVLEAIGGGDRTHANIAATAGSRQGALPSGSLSPLLRRLAYEKRVLAVDEPLSTRPDKPALYRVADSNLRLYLAVGRHAHELARRGRPESAVQLVCRRWPTWRGRVVEPLVRQSLELAGASGVLPWPDEPDQLVVGGWWNRQFNPEVDLVGADRGPVARRVYFAGSVKWTGVPFDDHDRAELMRGAVQVPGFSPGDSGLVVVSLSGLTNGRSHANVDLAWDAHDVLASWRPTG
jgi:hypothetical protein